MSLPHTPTTGSWRRVSRSQRCPVCTRPDWCLITADGTAALCQRVESPKRCGDAGYLHRLADGPAWDGRRTSTIKLRTSSTFDWSALARDYQDRLDFNRLRGFCATKGLSTSSLIALGVGSAGSALTFPMHDGRGQVVGVRLRTGDGAKKCVRGSKLGLFVPSPPPTPGERLYVAEGETDLAALLDLGLANAIGRPGCGNGTNAVCEFVTALRPAEVVVVADNDAEGAGQRGAENLGAALLAFAPVRVVVPGRHKDVREYLNTGGTKRGFESAVAAAALKRLKTRGVPAW